MIETRETIEREISSLYRRIGLELRVNNCEEANRLREEVGQLERRKQNLKTERKP